MRTKAELESIRADLIERFPKEDITERLAIFYAIVEDLTVDMVKASQEIPPDVSLVRVEGQLTIFYADMRRFALLLIGYEEEYGILAEDWERSKTLHSASCEAARALEQAAYARTLN